MTPMPIAKAPKDGRPLLFTDGANYACGRWNRELSCWTFDEEIFDVLAEDQLPLFAYDLRDLAPLPESPRALFSAS